MGRDRAFLSFRFSLGSIRMLGTTELGLWDRGEGAQGIVMLADIAGLVTRAMGEELTLLGRIQERREAE